MGCVTTALIEYLTAHFALDALFGLPYFPQQKEKHYALEKKADQQGWVQNRIQSQTQPS
jgi:hypothetical protein